MPKALIVLCVFFRPMLPNVGEISWEILGISKHYPKHYLDTPSDTKLEATKIKMLLINTISSQVKYNMYFIAFFSISIKYHSYTKLVVTQTKIALNQNIISQV